MEAASEISAAVTAIHRTAYGQVLSSVETVVGNGCVACVLRFEVTRLSILIQAGDAPPEPALRRTELSLEPSLRAAIERTTGRSVQAFQASMSPEHGLILEAFVLEPLN